MRRSRAFIVFGAFWMGLGIATVSVHSQAAGRYGNSDALGAMDEAIYSRDAARAADLLGWPRPADGKTALAKRLPPAVFGSFLRPGPAPAARPSGDACPPDMVGVEGDYCPILEPKCLRWLDAEKLQCAEFERGQVASCLATGQPKRFCVDRYEWPNTVGVLPRYMASWSEAKASCESIGKRLCSDTEWTLACEGPERQPYPYGDGYVRDDSACNIDKPYIWPHPEKLFDPKAQDEELTRLDQREPSGSRPACVSPYGVHDMVGNVDEWVVNESQNGKPYRSGLKGGYWGPVRTRCRPMTTAHDESFRYYQIGFRCCSQAQVVEDPEMPLASR
jgi:formylglycine-generating enzyme